MDNLIDFLPDSTVTQTPSIGFGTSPQNSINYFDMDILSSPRPQPVYDIIPDLTSLVISDFVGDSQIYPLPNYYSPKEISQNRSPKKPQKPKQTKTILTIEPFRSEFSQESAVKKLKEILGAKKLRK